MPYSIAVMNYAFKKDAVDSHTLNCEAFTTIPRLNLFNMFKGTLSWRFFFFSIKSTKNGEVPSLVHEMRHHDEDIK